MKPFIHLVLALIVCSVAFLGYGLFYGAISAKSAGVAALQNQINVRTATVARLATARAALSELSTDESAVEDYFVPETGVVSFIDGLQARGRSLGATVKVLSVSPESTARLPILRFSVSVEGTFDSVMRTVGSIEYAPYAVSITGLSVQATARNSWQASLSFIVGSRATAPKP